MKTGSKNRLAQRPEAGLSLTEIAISLALLMILMLSAVTAFTRSISASSNSGILVRGSFYLETLSENISALTFDEMLALNGNRVFDETNASDSNFAADLTVFPSGVDQIQMQIRVVHLASGALLGQASMRRSNWNG